MHDRPFKKCARVVGEVLGKYHPHGDTAVYDALVRMAQDFSMRSPLVNGHGNFGSVDNDPPAAMRYTECRLQALTSAGLLHDIELETVDFADNFDGSQQEPTVLPARIPQLLLNGSSGIAVGMATNMAPHNINEVIDATVAYINDNDIEISGLMQHIKTPDFPTGGIIYGHSGAKDAYETGRGRIVIRAKAEIESHGHDRERIIVNEIPYQVNKAMMIERTAELVNEKKLEGISEIRDESDRAGALQISSTIGSIRASLRASANRGAATSRVSGTASSRSRPKRAGSMMMTPTSSSPHITPAPDMPVHDEPPDRRVGTLPPT